MMEFTASVLEYVVAEQITDVTEQNVLALAAIIAE